MDKCTKSVFNGIGPVDGVWGQVFYEDTWNVIVVGVDCDHKP